MFKLACISPHPPLLIPEIADQQKHLVKKTLQAMDDLAREIGKIQPEIIVIISPHGPMRYDKFTINLEEKLKGDFLNFGDSSFRYSFYNSITLAREFFFYLRSRNIPVEFIREGRLDHGSLVPLHFLTKYLEKKPELIPLTFTYLDATTHFRFGQAMGEIIAGNEKNILFIASGDLSHRLTQDAPAGFSPYGAKFDETLASLLKKNQVEKILRLNPELCQEAGECGYRSILVALGVISHFKYTFEKFSYEGPFGVGYLTGLWRVKSY